MTYDELLSGMKALFGERANVMEVGLIPNSRIPTVQVSLGAPYRNGSGWTNKALSVKLLVNAISVGAEGQVQQNAVLDLNDFIDALFDPADGAGRSNDFWWDVIIDGEPQRDEESSQTVFSLLVYPR